MLLSGIRPELLSTHITNIMKLVKYLLCGAIALAATSCYDEPHGPSTKRPAGSTPDTPVTPVNPDDVKSPTPTFTLATQKATLTPGTTYQEIEGFGASDCWLPNTIGQYWTSNRQDIATLLFSQKISGDQPRGIGLSMWRVNLGGGTAEQGDAGGIDLNSRAEAYLQANGSWDWTKCAGQRYFMEQARNNGVEKFILFSNTPLVQFTKNGKGYSASGAYANLKDDCYGAFADYMAEVASHYISDGYNVTHISPVNEPQYDWNGTNQEGSGWQNKEVARLTRELDRALTEKSLPNVGISVGEAGHYVSMYSGNSQRENTINAFFDPSSDAYIGDLKHVGNLICGHSYWTFSNWADMRDVRSKLKRAADAKGLRVWQTEWSMLDKEPEDLGGSYDDVSEFDIAQYMSRIIHNDLTVAGVTSWSYWTAMSVERYSQKNRFELIKTTPAGGNYSDDFKVGGNFEATHNLWVLGNYSLFVRPGYKRCDLALSETKDFFGSAYIAPDNSKLVMVITNYSKERGASIDMAAPEGTKAIYRYTTTNTKHLQMDRFNIADKVFVDPASVTTVVYEF